MKEEPTETMRVEFPVALRHGLLPDYNGGRKSEVDWEKRQLERKSELTLQ